MQDQTLFHRGNTFLCNSENLFFFPHCFPLPGFLVLFLISHFCECVISHSVVSDSLQPMDCSTPGSSFCGFSQARILEWVAISFSRGSSRPGDWTHISCISEFLQISSELSWSIPTLKWGSTRVIRKLYVFELDCLSWCLGHRCIFRVDFFVCLSVRVFFFDWPVSSERKAWLLVFSRKGQKTLSIMTTFT